MKNAKHIGFDIARSVGLGLGKPINIHEETSHVKEGIFPCSHNNTDERKTLNELIDEKTVSVSTSIKVTFELKPKPKT